MKSRIPGHNPGENSITKISQMQFLEIILEGKQDEEAAMIKRLVSVSLDLEKTMLLSFAEWEQLLQDGLQAIEADFIKSIADQAEIWAVNEENFDLLTETLNRILHFAQMLQLKNYTIEIQTDQLHFKNSFGDKKPSEPLFKCELLAEYTIKNLLVEPINLKIGLEANLVERSRLEIFLPMCLGCYLGVMSTQQPGSTITCNLPIIKTT